MAYDWIPLKDDELVVWLPPDHPWTAEKEIPVEWLNGAPFIIPLPDHDTDIDRFLAANQVQPDVRFTTTDPYTAYCMVEEGLGISVNNRLTTEKWAGRVELRPLAPAQSIPRHPGNVPSSGQVRRPGLAGRQRQPGKIGV